MKNFSLILNILLLVAVVFLYFKIYSSKSETSPVIIQGTTKESPIVYINSDSLLDHYDFYLAMKSTFEKKRDSIDNILQYRDKNLKTEAMQYQQKAESMTEEERAHTEEGLMQKQQELVQLRDKLLDYLTTEEEKMNDTIHSHLTGFLKKYNQNHGYHFILGVQKGSGVLLANDSLNITKQVVKGLNKE